MAQPPTSALSLLRLAADALALPGGEAAGTELLGGLLAAGGVAAYFCACLGVVLACRAVSPREAGLRLLTQQPLDSLPLSVLVDAITQVPPPTCISADACSMMKVLHHWAYASLPGRHSSPFVMEEEGRAEVLVCR